MAGGDGKKGAVVEAPTEYKFAIKPDIKPGWAGFMQFLWNSETSEFLGRTGMSWLKIGVFYIIYYGFLAGFFMAMLLIFYQTLDDNVPKWQNTNGIIGGNPGVGFRPRPADANIDSTLIWYTRGEKGTWPGWVERLEKNFLAEYKNETDTVVDDEGKKINKISCGPLATKVPGTNQMCKINQQELFQGDCTKDNTYGFRQGKPCILIKLNKIFGWLPDPLNETEKVLPDDLPDKIKNLMKLNEEGQEGGPPANPEKNKRVWLDCRGQNPADVENLGPLKYYPDEGFSASYYPYLHQKGYLSPVVFVQLQQPRTGVMIAVECKAWAKNIKHDSMERKGLAHFEIMID